MPAIGTKGSVNVERRRRRLLRTFETLMVSSMSVTTETPSSGRMRDRPSMTRGGPCGANEGSIVLNPRLPGSAGSVAAEVVTGSRVRSAAKWPLDVERGITKERPPMETATRLAHSLLTRKGRARALNVARASSGNLAGSPRLKKWARVERSAARLRESCSGRKSQP